MCESIYLCNVCPWFTNCTFFVLFQIFINNLYTSSTFYLNQRKVSADTLNTSGLGLVAWMYVQCNISRRGNIKYPRFYTSGEYCSNTFCKYKRKYCSTALLQVHWVLHANVTAYTYWRNCHATSCIEHRSEILLILFMLNNTELLNINNVLFLKLFHHFKCSLEVKMPITISVKTSV